MGRYVRGAVGLTRNPLAGGAATAAMSDKISSSPAMPIWLQHSEQLRPPSREMPPLGSPKRQSSGTTEGRISGRRLSGSGGEARRGSGGLAAVPILSDTLPVKRELSPRMSRAAARAPPNPLEHSCTRHSASPRTSRPRLICASHTSLRWRRGLARGLQALCAVPRLRRGRQQRQQWGLRRRRLRCRLLELQRADHTPPSHRPLIVRLGARGRCLSVRRGV